MVQVRLKVKTLTAVVAIALWLCLAAHAASKYRVLHSFTGSDGSGPYGGVTLDQKGDLYGTTAGGGVCGTVFRLKSQTSGRWEETVLYQFGSGHDPCDPWSSIIFDDAHNLYATTVGGGAYYSGTVFELTRGSDGWMDSVLYSFGAHSNDAYAPSAGLVMDNVGNLYGTGHAVFELQPDSGGWSEKVLHHFCSWSNCRDGDGPFAGLILDASGNLYGTTEDGGGNCGSCGVVFELDSVSGGTWREHVLHAFDNNGKDGYTPGNGALITDAKGNLYGTTEVGVAGEWGTVFRLTRGTDDLWREAILYNFKNGPSGGFPAAGVVMDKAGNLYGTTDSGGTTSCDCGVVYKLAPGKNGKWTYAVLHAFSGIDGAIPAGNLTLDDKGNLYGGTVLGGSTGNGVIFELTP
jgi:uncharacterized repeat protein (TIGR03803 family)